MDQAALPRAIDRLGAVRALDVVDRPLSKVAHALTRRDDLSRLLHGAVIGHRLHPLLTDIPIGSWTSAAILDVIGGRAERPRPSA